MDAARKFAERNEMPLQVADLEFVRLAECENEEIVAAVEPGLQLARGDLRHLHARSGGLFAADSAEFVVVDEPVDGALCSTHGAVRILAELQFTELHAQRVKEQQPADKGIAAAENQLDGLHGLNRTDNAG